MISKDLAPHVRKLMSSRNATIRDAGSGGRREVGHRGGHAKPVRPVGRRGCQRSQAGGQIADGRSARRRREAAAREEAVLAAWASRPKTTRMRILATCGGEKTANAFARSWMAPMPGGRSTPRGCWPNCPTRRPPPKPFAAWRSSPCSTTRFISRAQALISRSRPDLYFHQVTGRLNRDPQAYTAGEGPVQIPGNLLAPFAWDDGEQQYAVRCYQLAEVSRDGYGPGLDVDFFSAQFGR